MPRGRAPPSPDEVLEFISESPTPVGKREIARAFGLKGADRAVIDDILKGLEREGLLGRRGPRARRRAKSLPPVAVIEVTSVDSDGEALARPHGWTEEDAPPPVIRLRHDRRPGIAAAPGDRILARLEATEDPGAYEARAIRRLPAETPRTVLGFYDVVDGHGRLRPTSRRVKAEIRIPRREAKDARPGELVRVEIQPGRRLGLAEARVLDRLGEGEPWRTASLIAIEENDIPDRFAADALAEAADARAAPLGAREDLRDVPLVTIDDETARDFDDAVWAEPDADPDNPGGFHLVVAIADVAWYVRPDGALDRAARERGNSVYFPDRVVPMLPEALSNGWCSLKPDEDRPCLAVHMWIDAAGHKRRHRFVRALMRSAARLTYGGVQAAIEGAASGVPEAVVGPAFAAWRALAAERARRGTLDLDIPERRVVLAEDGRVERIERREVLASHRLIEEFMILANVAAAETLEARGAPCVYRVHDSPDPAKVESLREMLGTLGIRLPRGQVLRARDFARLLAEAGGGPHAALVHEAVLRTQAQAAYSPENIGHFGLALRRYAHFTSPIRRYADLLVHRALIAALGLGAGGPGEADATRLETTCKHISSTERRAAAAERQAVDRLAAAYLADRVGAELGAYVTGLTRAGVFVRLDETGADALVPLSFLGAGPVRLDAHGHRLTAGRDATLARLGDRVRVRLREVDVLTGSLVCDLLGATRRNGKRPARGRRGRTAR